MICCELLQYSRIIAAKDFLLSVIYWASDSSCSSIEDIGIDHGG